MMEWLEGCTLRNPYEAETPTVSARELHKSLEISKRFSAWFDTNSQGFVENEDYTSVLTGTEVQNNGGVQIRELQDYSLSVDMAKQICMIQRSEKGKQYRQYFLDLEKAWNTPEQRLKTGFHAWQNMDLMQELISTRSLLSRFALKVYDKVEKDYRTEQSVRVRESCNKIMCVRTLAQKWAKAWLLSVIITQCKIAVSVWMWLELFKECAWNGGATED